MKFTVNVECTPEEARSFLGLPDLVSLQTAMRERMQQAGADLTSEGLMRHWLALLPAAGEEMQKAVQNFLQTGGRKPETKTDS